MPATSCRIVTISCFAIALIGYLGFLALPRHGIVEGASRRIRPGMSLREVESILGGPPGDYGPESVAAEWTPIAVPEFPEREQTWMAGYLAISVLFDDDGKVVHSQESRRVIGEESRLEKVRRWVRLKR